MPVTAPAALKHLSAADGGGLHIRARGLGVRRGERWIFRGIEIEIPAGEFVAVAGPSGVGKSTLLGCVAGMIRPSEGEVAFYDPASGVELTPDGARRRIGMVFQNLHLVQNMPLLKNVLCGRLGRRRTLSTLFGFPRGDREAAHGLLHELGLGHCMHRWAAEVSGGEQQRTAVARALIQEAGVLLADEPVSNLDRALAARVLELLRARARSSGSPVLCVLHDPDLICGFADRVLSFAPADPRGWRIEAVERQAR